MEFLELKNLTEHKDLVIEKADKANTVVIANRTKYLEVIKSLYLDCRKLIPLPINEDKWINYIIATYKTDSLAKYLNRILLPLTTNEFTLKKFFDFAEEVVNYEHNLYMASLDGELLFTNIPLAETIKNCVNDLFSNNVYCGKLSRKDLYQLLKLATSELSFIFDIKLYKEIDGVAMD